jgi:hypothetical protein
MPTEPSAGSCNVWTGVLGIEQPSLDSVRLLPLGELYLV